MKRQKAFSLLQLLIEVVITLFIAGIVVPSLLRSDVAMKEALAVGSLHNIKIAGVVLSYTNQNVELAFAIHFADITPKNTSFTRTTTLRAAPLQH